MLAQSHCLRRKASVQVNTAANPAIYEYELPAGTCSGSVCLYPKDGQFEHSPYANEMLPACSFSSDNQKSQICKYVVNVRLPLPATAIGPLYAM